MTDIMFIFSQEEEKKDNRVKGRGEEGAHDLMSSEVEIIISRHHNYNYNHNHNQRPARPSGIVGQVSTVFVFLTSHFAPTALSSDLTNLGPLMTMKIHLETLKNHGNQPKTMKNHGNQAKTMKPP